MTAQINEKVRTDSSRLHMINEIIARIIIIHGPLQHSFQCRSFHDNEGTVLLVQFSRRGQALLNILMSIPLHQYNLSPPYFFDLCAFGGRIQAICRPESRVDTDHAQNGSEVSRDGFLSERFRLVHALPHQTKKSQPSRQASPSKPLRNAATSTSTEIQTL